MILTDFSMPHLDGIDSTRAIREYLNNLGISPLDQPIIIGVTGHTENEFRKRGLEAGMNNVVSKPLYLKDMKALLSDLGEQ